MQWIALYNQCQTFSCLPEAGGMFDQAPITVTVFYKISELVGQKQEMESKRNAAERSRRTPAAARSRRG